MNSRDDFSPDTIKRLAMRAANRCSFPTCRRVTVGPSEESPVATSNTGVASHISAAASGPGARRYKQMSSEERTSIANGIWMCQTHGKLIDADEIRFSISMLETWKLLAETLAQLEHDHGITLVKASEAVVGQIPLIDEIRELSDMRRDMDAVGELFDDSCAPLLWGNACTEAIRDFTFEVLQNSVKHGGATNRRVEIGPCFVRITDNGSPFDVSTLAAYQSGSGGKHAALRMADVCGTQAVLTQGRDGDVNSTQISFVTKISELRATTTCITDLDGLDTHFGGPWNTEIPGMTFMTECNDVIYIVAPRYVSYSPMFLMVRLAKKLGRRYVYVVERASRGVLEALRGYDPGCEVLVLG